MKNNREPQPGDLLWADRSVKGQPNHYGICVSGGNVIHFASQEDSVINPDTAKVHQTAFEHFKDGCPVKIIDIKNSLSAEESLRRAQQSIGMQGYDSASFNCGHFATYCKIGKYCSIQTDAVKTGQKEIALKEAGGSIITLACEIHDINGMTKTPGPDTGLAQENEIERIHTIPKLQAFLGELEKREGLTVLGYLLKAQLQVLDVVQSLQVNLGVFDFLLHQLDKAVEMSENDSQKKLIQEKSAVMVNSMILFMEAKTHFKKNKWIEEGLELLKTGCNMVADTAPSIVNLVLSKDEKLAVYGFEIFETLVQDREFLNQLSEYYAADQKNKTEQMQNDFNNFIIGTLDKLDNYKEMFGRSILMAELFNHYSHIIVKSKIEKTEQRRKQPQKPATPQKRKVKSLTYRDTDLTIVLTCEIVILVIILIIQGIMGNLPEAAVILLIIPATVIFIKAKDRYYQKNNDYWYDVECKEADAKYEKELKEYNSKCEEYDKKVAEYAEENKKIENYYQSIIHYFRSGK
jgi:hypothetical protein